MRIPWLRVFKSLYLHTNFPGLIIWALENSTLPRYKCCGTLPTHLLSRDEPLCAFPDFPTIRIGIHYSKSVWGGLAWYWALATLRSTVKCDGTSWIVYCCYWLSSARVYQHLLCFAATGRSTYWQLRNSEEYNSEEYEAVRHVTSQAASNNVQSAAD